MGKDIILPAFMIVLIGILFSIFLPYMPVDETRYLSVAWDMNIHNCFLVPLLNGKLYSHKPPFLFWLIDLDWWIFGVNEISLRFINVVFSLLTIILTYKISWILWKDRRRALYSVYILSSTFLYLIWSALIMFDIILTFWLLLGIYGILKATKEYSSRAYLLVILSIVGGIFTKGPVIFVHLIPFLILIGIHQKFDNSMWSKMFFSLFIGIIWVLIWIIAVKFYVSEGYINDILWHQNIDRLIHSFAHRRPVWWYLPLLPIVFFPWVLVPLVCWKSFTPDKNERLFLYWFFIEIFLFSLISGKQIHYLIPEIPIFSILTSANLIKCNKINKKIFLHLLGLFYIFLGIFIIFFRPLSLFKEVLPLNFINSMTTAVILIIVGYILLRLHNYQFDDIIRIVSISSFFIIVAILIFSSDYLKYYDLKRPAMLLGKMQKQGYTIVKCGKYEGEFNFLGRLKSPIVVKKDCFSFLYNLRSPKKYVFITHNTLLCKNSKVYYYFFYRGKKFFICKNFATHSN